MITSRNTNGGKRMKENKWSRIRRPGPTTIRGNRVTLKTKERMRMIIRKRTIIRRITVSAIQIPYDTSSKKQKTNMTSTSNTQHNASSVNKMFHLTMFSHSSSTQCASEITCKDILS